MVGWPEGYNELYGHNLEQSQNKCLEKMNNTCSIVKLYKEDDGKIKGYTPSQISSLILSKLKDYTSGVKKAVVTVPALFAERARSATLEAAKLSKLDVEIVVESE